MSHDKALYKSTDTFTLLYDHHNNELEDFVGAKLYCLRIDTDILLTFLRFKGQITL